MVLWTYGADPVDRKTKKVEVRLLLMPFLMEEDAMDEEGRNGG